MPQGDEAEGSEDAAKVAKTLGSIPIGQWIAFGKLGVPALASILGALYLPMTAYLDGRDEALTICIKEEILADLSLDGAKSRVESLRSQIGKLEDDMSELEAELAGARQVREAIAEKIGDARERLIRVETMTGADRLRREARPALEE